MMLKINHHALLRPVALLGLGIVLIHLVLALAAPWLAPYDPMALNGGRAEPPSAEFWLGTDVLGRDYLSRLLWGGRTALLAAFTGVVVAVTVGSVLGVTAAYLGGLFDDIMMRIVDLKLALPGILFVALFAVGFGESLPVLIVLIGMVYFPGVIRIVRAQALTQVHLGYVRAAQLRGEGTLSIIVRELLPNTLDVVYVEFAIRMSHAILLLSSLSFLGMGISPPTPDWGLMVAEGVSQLAYAPLLVLAPALFIATLVVGLNFGAEALARALGLDATRGQDGA
ncbi:MAG: ABC transporter permease [Burkholderiaceae bacterium]|jgi:peptide/nickel transport system permease protein|nr:ABC transporter permease [Burkholderiaceae bacterium]